MFSSSYRMIAVPDFETKEANSIPRLNIISVSHRKQSLAGCATGSINNKPERAERAGSGLMKASVNNMTITFSG